MCSPGLLKGVMCANLFVYKYDDVVSATFLEPDMRVHVSPFGYSLRKSALGCMVLWMDNSMMF